MYGVTHRNPIPRVVGSIGFFGNDVGGLRRGKTSVDEFGSRNSTGILVNFEYDFPKCGAALV